jgi:hypothetical protein
MIKGRWHITKHKGLAKLHLERYDKEEAKWVTVNIMGISNRTEAMLKGTKRFYELLF